MPGQVTLTASILAANDPAGVSDCSGAVSSGGYNVIGSTTGCTYSAAGTDLTGTGVAPLDAGLSALAFHDGITKTMGLAPDSPAIDLVPTASGGCPSDDQRGVPRPQGTNCEAGSLEVASTSLTIGAPKTVTAGTKAKIRGQLSSAAASCEDAQVLNLVKGTTVLKSQATSAGGAYAFTLRIKKGTTIHVEFADTPACSASTSKNKTINVT